MDDDAEQSLLLVDIRSTSECTQTIRMDCRNAIYNGTIRCISIPFNPKRSAPSRISHLRSCRVGLSPRPLGCVILQIIHIGVDALLG